MLLSVKKMLLQGVNKGVHLTLSIECWSVMSFLWFVDTLPYKDVFIYRCLCVDIVGTN